MAHSVGGSETRCPVRVSFVIVSHDRSAMILRLVRSIKAHVLSPAWEVIIVDNASTEDVASQIRAEFPEVILRAESINHGFARGCNLGAEMARGEFLLFVNNDIELLGNSIPDMITELDRDPSTGLVGCELRNEDGSAQPTAFRFPSLGLRWLQLSGLKKVILRLRPSLRRGHAMVEAPDFLSGAFLMVRRSVFSEVRGFDEGYFMYLEDADLAYRLRERGLRCRILHDPYVVHFGRHYELQELGPVTLRMNRGLVRFYAIHHGHGWLRLLAVSSLLFLAMRWLTTVVRGGSSQNRHSVQELLALYGAALFRPGAVADARSFERPAAARGAE